MGLLYVMGGPLPPAPARECESQCNLLMATHRSLRQGEQSGVSILHFLSFFFAVSCQSFQLAFLLSQECRGWHLEIYCQSNGFEIRFGIGGCCSFTFFTIFLIHDSNTYHGHGMTFRFDLCLLNVTCGDKKTNMNVLPTIVFRFFF